MAGRKPAYGAPQIIRDGLAELRARMDAVVECYVGIEGAATELHDDACEQIRRARREGMAEGRRRGYADAERDAAKRSGRDASTAYAQGYADGMRDATKRVKETATGGGE